MVAETLGETRVGTATSLVALKQMIADTYDITPNRYALLQALKKGVEGGELVKVKASYRLAGRGGRGAGTKKVSGIIFSFLI